MPNILPTVEVVFVGFRAMAARVVVGTERSGVEVSNWEGDMEYVCGRLWEG